MTVYIIASQRKSRLPQNLINRRWFNISHALELSLIGRRTGSSVGEYMKVSKLSKQWSVLEPCDYSF